LVSQNTVTARIKDKTGSTFSDNLNDTGFNRSRNEQK